MSLRARSQSLLLFSQILENASLGHLLSWRRGKVLTAAPESRFETRRRDSNLVSEFRAKLRDTEDLLAKLGYSLREITEKNRH